MIDTHIHARIGWTKRSVSESLRACTFERALLAAAPIDHWGTELNEGCARIIRQFPNRLTGLVGIHPPDLNRSLRDIEKYGRLGFAGIKLMPTTGYYPDDDRFRPVFEEVNARRWMVLTHCGLCSPGTKRPDLPQSTRFSDPYHIEPLARVFTRTDFILAHGGGSTFFAHAAEMTRYLRNVYIDTCPGNGHWVLRNGGPWIEVLDWSRVLFGTDAILGDVREDRAYGEKVEAIALILRDIGRSGRLETVMKENAVKLLRRHGIPAAV